MLQMFQTSEKLLVGSSGAMIIVTTASTGEILKSEAFVALLSENNYTLLLFYRRSEWLTSLMPKI